MKHIANCLIIGALICVWIWFLGFEVNWRVLAMDLHDVISGAKL